MSPLTLCSLIETSEHMVPYADPPPGMQGPDNGTTLPGTFAVYMYEKTQTDVRLILKPL